MIRVETAISSATISEARSMFREYARIPGVAPCLDDFERETAALPGAYASPAGVLLLAVNAEPGRPVEAAGCVALRRWDETTGEMKRLYVRPAFRGRGVGRSLVSKLIAEAQAIGYSRMVLDTLPTMTDAHKLYRSIGFREIASYQKTPIPGALFFELLLNEKDAEAGNRKRSGRRQ